MKTKKLTELKIKLNKKGFNKLKKKNMCANLSEEFSKQMIKEALLTNANEGTISLELNHKTLGRWIFVAKIAKEEIKWKS